MLLWDTAPNSVLSVHIFSPVYFFGKWRVAQVINLQIQITLVFVRL